MSLPSVQNSSGSHPLFSRHYEGIKERVILSLEEHGIPFIPANEIALKGKNDTGLLNIPGDGHPTDEFNKRLASYLLKMSQGSINSNIKT